MGCYYYCLFVKMILNLKMSQKCLHDRYPVDEECDILVDDHNYTYTVVIFPLCLLLQFGDWSY